jgi:hypothetical protein
VKDHRGIQDLYLHSKMMSFIRYINYFAIKCLICVYCRTNCGYLPWLISCIYCPPTLCLRGLQFFVSSVCPSQIGLRMINCEQKVRLKLGVVCKCILGVSSSTSSSIMTIFGFCEDSVQSYELRIYWIFSCQMISFEWKIRLKLDVAYKYFVNI